MKNPEPGTVGERIRQVRESLGLKGKEFALLVGLKTAGNVSRYEAGRSRPDPGVLIRIARAGGRSLDWLLTGSEDPDSLPRQAMVLVREAPVVYQSLLDDLAGNRRLLQAVRDLIEVLKGPDEQAAEWLLGNITVFADRARGQSRKRKRREAG